MKASLLLVSLCLAIFVSACSAQKEVYEGADFYSSDFYKALPKDRFVLEVRAGIDRFMASDRKAMVFLNDQKYAAYYKGRFAVHGKYPSPAGGFFVDLIFVDRRDKLFMAWVYRLSDGSPELRMIEDKEADAAFLDTLISKFQPLAFTL